MSRFCCRCCWELWGFIRTWTLDSTSVWIESPEIEKKRSTVGTVWELKTQNDGSWFDVASGFGLFVKACFFFGCNMHGTWRESGNWRRIFSRAVLICFDKQLSYDTFSAKRRLIARKRSSWKRVNWTRCQGNNMGQQRNNMGQQRKQREVVLFEVGNLCNKYLESESYIPEPGNWWFPESWISSENGPVHFHGSLSSAFQVPWNQFWWAYMTSDLLFFPLKPWIILGTSSSNKCFIKICELKSAGNAKQLVSIKAEKLESKRPLHVNNVCHVAEADDFFFEKGNGGWGI